MMNLEHQPHILTNHPTTEVLGPKELKRLKGAMRSMKSNNKYDKSISQKHFMIMRSERELKWLKSIKPRQRRMLNFSLQATEKSSLEVLDFHKAHLSFEGMKRPKSLGTNITG